MGIFEDIKKKVDLSSDGKLNADDLNHLKEKYGQESGDLLDRLKAQADSNDDGKIDLSDVALLKEQLTGKK